MNAPVAIVTGAGSGVGRETCRLLADAGYCVALAGRNEATLKQTQQLLPTHAPSIEIVADVAIREQASGIVDRAMQQWGRIDVLINNAAILHVSDIAVVNESDWRETFNANVLGPAFLISACWPIFQRQNGGRIVNISSVAVLDPFPGLGMYAASKAALESISRSVCVEGRPHSIKAFSITLGATETAMLRQVVSDDQLPRDQVLRPADVAKMILECAQGQRDDQAGTSIVLRRSP